MQKEYNRFKKIKFIKEIRKKKKTEEERKRGKKKKGKLLRTAKAQWRGRDLSQQ